MVPFVSAMVRVFFEEQYVSLVYSGKENDLRSVYVCNQLTDTLL